MFFLITNTLSLAVKMTDRIIREVSKTVSLKRKYYPLLILQFSFPVLFLIPLH